MAHIVLFHSVLGLRPGVRQFALRLEAAGHKVTLPDLYHGEFFGNYEEGNEKWTALGIPKLLQRAQTVSNRLKGKLVFAGFSNGAALAEFVAATHPHAKGALLFHGALPLEVLQLTAWPSHVPVQVHYGKDDPFRNPENDTALKLAVKASGAQFEEFLYPVSTHLFADPDLPDFDEDAAALLLKRAAAFAHDAVS